MTITYPYQISFDLDLILGDLGSHHFARHYGDPMDSASIGYCKVAAHSLAAHSGRAWQGVTDPRGQSGYLIHPQPELDPSGWPKEAVASITLSTPPISIEAAQHVREEIVGWVRSMENHLNEDISNLSCECSWVIKVHSDPATSISVPGLVTAPDELELLVTMHRHSSGVASPQRHAFGPTLLRHIKDGAAMKVLPRDMHGFLFDNCSRDCRTAIDLGSLNDNTIGLRHFASWAFFHRESIPSLIGDFIEAAALTGPEAETVAQRTLEKFKLLGKWLDTIERLFQLKVANTASPLPPPTEIIYAGAPAGIMLWDGTARLTLNADKDVESPTIFRQNMTDWKEALAVLALDIAEIRAAGLDPLPIENEKLSFEIDRLAQTLRNHGLLGTGSIAEMDFHDLH